jgi:hypothetical protein
MRQWALARWDEDTQVSLISELPAIKEEIRLERERGEAAAFAAAANGRHS